LRVLFLIEGWRSPAPRYRVLQYLPYLVEQGITFKVRSLHGEKYPFFHRWPLFGKLYKFFVRVRRLLQIGDAEEFDLVFQQRLTLPFSDWIERRIMARNPRFVLDFDDAIYQSETGEDARRQAAFARVMRRSALVVAGSAYLARAADRECHVLPTVIDTRTYLPAKSTGEEIVIGWIGTHSNYPNFQPLCETLARVLDRYEQVRLQIVGDYEPDFNLPKSSFTRWRADREIADLQSFHIGIMPLADTSWNRGKCAFKLIQYMAVGIPVVAGAVGANLEVVQEGVTGFLVSRPEEWEGALCRLIEDKDLRTAMGKAGRKRCVTHYSLTSQRERFVKVLNQAATWIPR